MIMPIEISWHFSQVSPFPILEFFGVIKSTIYVSEFMQLQLALKMINTVEKYGAIIIGPVDNVPIGPNIFFTARFNSDKDIMNFINGLGAERIG